MALEDAVKELEKRVGELERGAKKLQARLDELERGLERVKIQVGLGGRLNLPR